MNQLGFHGRSRFPSLGPGPSPQTSQAEENFNPFRTIPGSIMQSNYVRWNQPWDVVLLCENVTPFRRRTWLAWWRPCHEGGRVHPRLSPGDHDLPVKSSWVFAVRISWVSPVPEGFASPLCQLCFWSAFKASNQNSFEWPSPDVFRMTQLTGADLWHSSQEIHLITLITDGEAAKIRTNIERTWSNTCFDL